MHSYVEEVEAPSARVRLKLGQLLVQKQERPARALKVLEQIPEGSLPQPLEALRRSLSIKPSNCVQTACWSWAMKSERQPAGGPHVPHAFGLGAWIAARGPSAGAWPDRLEKPGMTPEPG